jgi:hypothetical protein
LRLKPKGLNDELPSDLLQALVVEIRSSSSLKVSSSMNQPLVLFIPNDGRGDAARPPFCLEGTEQSTPDNGHEAHLLELIMLWDERRPSNVA